MELDWHLFGLAVELQLDPDLDPLILPPAWRGLKLVELTAMCMTSFHPPFSERSRILNSVRASNLAWLPPTVHSNCSERLWLHARTFLVALGNRLSWPGESP